MRKTTLDMDMLIVDDNKGMLSLLRSIFRQLGVERIEVFERADDALQHLSHAAPDLILTDWEMAPLSGIELVRLLRQHHNPIIKRVPIIMVTAHADADRVLEARDAGVTEFLVKPISHKTASEKLRAVIKKPRLFIRTPDYTGPDRRRISKPIVTVERRRDIENFFEFFETDDEDAGAATAGLSPIGIRELRTYFEQTLPDRIKSIHTELEAAEIDPLNRRGHIGRMFRMVHDLKGHGSTFNYPLITELSTSLCLLIDETDVFDSTELSIIRKFVESMRVIADHRIQQDGGETGRALLTKMREIVLKYKSERTLSVAPSTAQPDVAAK